VNEELGLLNDIIENPDDDTPRKVYADWLYDHGDPDRAEFIHGQIDLGSMSQDDPGWQELYGRTSDLLRRHRHAWEAPVRGRGVQAVYFRHGFIDKVVATATAFVHRGAAWVADTPLRKVELTEVAGKAGRLAACRHLAHIRGLTIADSRFGDADVVALVRSPDLTGVTDLFIGGSFHYLHSTMVGDVGLAALATSPCFTQLTSLTVYSEGSIGSAGTASLAGAPAGSKLRRLHLHDTRIADPGAAALAGAAGLQGLVGLGIHGGRIGTEGLVAVLRSPHFRNLFSAGFPCNRVTPEVMHAVALADLPPTLDYLCLNGNWLGGIDIEAVGEVLRRQPGLATMFLMDCKLPPRVQRELHRRFRGRLVLDLVATERRRTRVSG
jgi:uncharacterized protein (TIGR02996 family)